MQLKLGTVKACIAAMAVLYNIKLQFDENFDYDGSFLGYSSLVYCN